jgi:hypothetical protein
MTTASLSTARLLMEVSSFQSFFFFFAALEFELRALHLLILEPTPTAFCLSYFSRCFWQGPALVLNPTYSLHMTEMAETHRHSQLID